MHARTSPDRSLSDLKGSVHEARRRRRRRLQVMIGSFGLAELLIRRRRFKELSRGALVCMRARLRIAASDLIIHRLGRRCSLGQGDPGRLNFG